MRKDLYISLLRIQHITLDPETSVEELREWTIKLIDMIEAQERVVAQQAELIVMLKDALADANAGMAKYEEIFNDLRRKVGA